MRQTLEKSADAEKLEKVIATCETEKQLQAAGRMVTLFIRKYGYGSRYLKAVTDRLNALHTHA